MANIREILRQKRETKGQTALRHFLEARQQGKQADEADLEFLTKAFRKVMDGTDPRKALQLETGRGRKKNHRDEWHHWAIAEYIIRKMAAGAGYDQAILDAANNYHCSESAAKLYYGRYKDLIREWQASMRAFIEQGEAATAEMRRITSAYFDNLRDQMTAAITAFGLPKNSRKKGTRKKKV